MLDRVRERIHPQEFIEARAEIESKPLPIRPTSKPLGWGRAMLDHLNAEAPVNGRDPFRYDPNRLLPSSARVRQVRVDRVVIEAPQPVAQLCAAAGLVYAKRHVVAELALYGAKAQVA